MAPSILLAYASVNGVDTIVADDQLTEAVVDTELIATMLATELGSSGVIHEGVVLVSVEEIHEGFSDELFDTTFQECVLDALVTPAEGGWDESHHQIQRIVRVVLGYDHHLVLVGKDEGSGLTIPVQRNLTVEVVEDTIQLEAFGVQQGLISIHDHTPLRRRTVSPLTPPRGS